MYPSVPLQSLPLTKSMPRPQDAPHDDPPDELREATKICLGKPLVLLIFMKLQQTTYLLLKRGRSNDERETHARRMRIQENQWI